MTRKLLEISADLEKLIDTLRAKATEFPAYREVFMIFRKATAFTFIHFSFLSNSTIV